MGGVVMAMKQFIVVLLVVLASTKLFSQDKESVDFDNPANYPLIGNWVGEWINPQKGHEALHPNIAAQILERMWFHLQTPPGQSKCSCSTFAIPKHLGS
jgi:hypothetical protein